MWLGARSRSVLVVAPLVVILFGYAAAGILRPRLLDPGLSTPVLVFALVTVGTGTASLLLRNTLRTSSVSRLFWGGAALSTVLSVLVTTGYLVSWPSWLVWGVLRGAVLVTFVATGTVISRSLQLSARDWWVRLLDGWLVAASVFVITWGGVSVTGSPPTGTLPSGCPALYWIGADVLLSSAVAGLVMRTRREVRGPLLLNVFASLLWVVIDTVWALTGSPRFGAPLWLIQSLTFAAATILEPVDVWHRPKPVDGYSPVLRLPQWSVVPALIVAVVLRRDGVVMVAAVGIVLGLAAELALSGQQNHELWRALRSQAERLDRLLRESRDAIVHVDSHGFVRFANDAVADVLGYGTEEVLDRNGLSLVHPADREQLVTEIIRLTDEGCDGGRVSARCRHADGSWRSLEATVARRSEGEAGYTLSARDVSDRVCLEDELRRLAGTDALTTLLNRPAFLTLLESRLREGPATVLFVDLDGFKSINDMDGHAAGDRLLREVAETLRRELRVPDVAARLGGDEFAVLLGTNQLAEARAVADRLVQRLRRMPSDPARRTAASVGVATGMDVTAEILLGDADLAMYEAKGRGGRRHVVFEPWMRERVTERARMSDALERACAGEGLLLDVQPIVTMADGRWVWFEALARWQDGPNRREPQEFLPVAEENGLIDPIGRWVLHQALVWLARWPDQAAGVSVNVAGSQLTTPGFGDWVHQQLAGHGVAANRLTLEISERTALGDLQRATAVLQPLRALGVRIALDDFGTGFSSLGHLAELPVDELKIDRRFVIGLGRRAQDDALVRAVCQLANDLGLQVVAEGVETAAQEFTLLEHGCQLGQGYRFLHPTSVSELAPPSGHCSPVTPVLRPTGWPTPDAHGRDAVSLPRERSGYR
jgi:diguanylate cyclase (GGDEF)-like protein/PAS domain S-box-containing protein